MHSLARRGGCGLKKMARSDLSAADGVVVQVQKQFRLILNHHPVRSIKGSFAIFLLMSRPPRLARRGHIAVAKCVIFQTGLACLTTCPQLHLVWVTISSLPNVRRMVLIRCSYP